MQNNSKKQFERHRDFEQETFYHVEHLSHTMQWTQCHTQDYKKGGKFLVFCPEFENILRTKSVGSEIKFLNETNALNMAKMLSPLTDRPLRVVKVQQIRVQKQTGKIILPTGGI